MANSNCGIILTELKRYSEAVVFFEGALFYNSEDEDAKQGKLNALNLMHNQEAHQYDAPQAAAPQAAAQVAAPVAEERDPVLLGRALKMAPQEAVAFVARMVEERNSMQLMLIDLAYGNARQEAARIAQEAQERDNAVAPLNILLNMFAAQSAAYDAAVAQEVPVPAPAHVVASAAASASAVPAAVEKALFSKEEQEVIEEYLAYLETLNTKRSRDDLERWGKFKDSATLSLFSDIVYLDVDQCVYERSTLLGILDTAEKASNQYHKAAAITPQTKVEFTKEDIKEKIPQFITSEAANLKEAAKRWKNEQAEQKKSKP